jgi:antitoxin component YwqK of YwqJK toxin-antitoxin module
MYDNGNLKFKGNVSNGKYDGDGELFYITGGIQYKGPFANGKYEGESGCIYAASGNKGYEGSFKAGKSFFNFSFGLIGNREPAWRRGVL